MAEHLYVCEFSNGHIKVGRSINPPARIEQHVERVSCVGIELQRHDFFLCQSSAVVCEAALIERCAQEAVEQFKNEWFAGLAFDVVCGWAKECAVTTLEDTSTPLQIAVREFGGTSKLAEALGYGCDRRHIDHWISGKGINPAHCHKLRELTGLPLSVLRPKDWTRIWPNEVDELELVHSNTNSIGVPNFPNANASESISFNAPASGS